MDFTDLSGDARRDGHRGRGLDVAHHMQEAGQALTRHRAHMYRGRQGRLVRILVAGAGRQEQQTGGEEGETEFSHGIPRMPSACLMRLPTSRAGVGRPASARRREDRRKKSPAEAGPRKRGDCRYSAALSFLPSFLSAAASLAASFLSPAGSSALGPSSAGASRGAKLTFCLFISTSRSLVTSSFSS